MPARLRVRNNAGEVLFDSSQEHVLFQVDDFDISGASVGSGLTYSYPAQTGRKIAAFMQCPYNNNDGEIEGKIIMCCRVSYPGGVPTVNVFYDLPPSYQTGLVKADGHLSIFDTGAPL